MCFYCAPIAATLTANYGACDHMAFLYGGDPVQNRFASKIEARNSVEDFLNMDVASCNLKRKERETAKDTLRSSTLKTV